MSTREYNVTFAVDGCMTVRADSPEEAEKLALDELEMLQLDADATIDGCTVQVVTQFSYDDNDEPEDCVKVERDVKVVEFA